MCGIVGYIGTGAVQNILLNGLKNLEYRGYDSAGLALNDNTGIKVYKASGKLNNLVDLLAHKNNTADTFKGIGHIRWATHGKPTVENAHPHLSNDEKIVLVHNGIIENYQELKDKLQAKGYTFHSKTDTETAVLLIEDEYKQTKNLEQGVINAIKQLKGAFAFCIMHQDEPDKIIAVRNHAPLILGQGQSGNFIASDIPALIGQADKSIYLDDRELAIVTKNNITIKTFEGVIKIKPMTLIDMKAESISRRGYPHFMLKEIMEQPDIMRSLLSVSLSAKDAPITFPGLDADKLFNNVTKLEIIACGTSLNAERVAKALFERLCRLPVEVTAASEYIYKTNLTDENTLCIGISQSGETADTITAVRQAKEAGAKVLVLTNRANSSIIRYADASLPLMAGIEISVAATKSYTAQLMVLYLLAVMLAEKSNKITPTYAETIKNTLLTLPALTEQVLELNDQAKTLAAKYKNATDFIYMARGINLATAAEGALKLKEISYINAVDYAAGELKHGPIALLDENMPVLAVLPKDSVVFAKVLSNCEEAKARRAPLIALTTESAVLPENIFDDVIRLPDAPELATPLLCAPFLQLFAYETACALGREVDQPRNLAKSVTVE
ncbi:MAG: glutamine--fructose-6-phosphate transaminase (isomerizing) [Alphaproteobacteria bacterium]|nr:glutamine--fructose-6-phosphate transaminase (isomerizing) [Alphaproteobacteria bacterium]